MEERLAATEGQLLEAQQVIANLTQAAAAAAGEDAAVAEGAATSSAARLTRAVFCIGVTSLYPLPSPAPSPARRTSTPMCSRSSRRR